MKIRDLRKVFSNQFCFTDAEDNTSKPLNRGGYSSFTFVENTISNLPKVLRAKFLGSNGLFCFVSICKFGSFKNPLVMITSLPELYFTIRRFILLVQTKKVISMNYGSSTSSWKPWWWVRLDLIFSMRDIYVNSNLNPLTKSTSSSRNTEFKDILPWNISQMITDLPILTNLPWGSWFRLESHGLKVRHRNLTVYGQLDSFLPLYLLEDIHVFKSKKHLNRSLIILPIQNGNLWINAWISIALLPCIGCWFHSLIF